MAINLHNAILIVVIDTSTIDLIVPISVGYTSLIFIVNRIIKDMVRFPDPAPSVLRYLVLGESYSVPSIAVRYGT